MFLQRKHTNWEHHSNPQGEYAAQFSKEVSPKSDQDYSSVLHYLPDTSALGHPAKCHKKNVKSIPQLFAGTSWASEFNSLN